MKFRIEYRGLYQDNYLCVDDSSTDEYIDDTGIVTVGDKTYPMTYYKEKKLICCGCGISDCEHKIEFLEIFKYRYL